MRWKHFFPFFNYSLYSLELIPIASQITYKSVYLIPQDDDHILEVATKFCIILIHGLEAVAKI